MRPLLAFAALVLGIAACDTVAGDRATTVRELQEAQAQISRATRDVTAGADAGEIRCRDGGTAYLQHSDEGGTLSFEQCEGLTGAMAWTYPVDESAPFRYRQRVSGTVQIRGGCRVEYDRYEVSFAYEDVVGDSLVSRATYDGRLGGDCPSGRVVCTFESTTLALPPERAPPDFTPYCR